MKDYIKYLFIEKREDYRLRNYLKAAPPYAPDRLFQDDRRARTPARHRNSLRFYPAMRELHG